MTTVNKLRNACVRLFFLLRKADYTPLILLWAVAAFYCALCPFIHKSIVGGSGYYTYTLQALAWRDGKFYLEQDYPWLELAVYQGHWYISFPPVPSIPLFFLTFLFGSNTPDNLLVKLYVAAGCIGIYYMLRGAGYGKGASAAFSLLCSLAGSLLSITSEGAVWYQAQTLAFGLTAVSTAAMYLKRPTLSLSLYALAVGCRPFNAVFGVFLFALYISQCAAQKTPFKKAFCRLLPGLVIGFLIACAYGWYNYIRFGNIFEFGHNYLPEFSWQGGVQFSLKSIPQNLQNFLLRMPFSWDGSQWQLNQFGFCFLIANPALALMLIWMLWDAFHRRFTWVKGVLLLCFLIQLFLLLMHRTFGGFQFGARYTCDLLPYPAVYLALKGHARKIHGAEMLILIAALAFAVYGFVTMSLG